MFFYLITVAIIGYSFVNFKKGFMQFLSYKVILVTNIAIISNPGMPLLTVDMFMSIFYIFMYFVVGKRKKYRKNVVRFPYKAPMLFMANSRLSSTLLLLKMSFTFAFLLCISSQDGLSVNAICVFILPE